MSTKQHPILHECHTRKADAAAPVQGPLHKKRGKETHLLMVLPQAMALRYLSFDDVAQTADG